MVVEAAASASSESSPLVAVKSAAAGHGGAAAAPPMAAGLWKMALGFVLGVALTVALLNGGFGGGSSSATNDHREEPATATMLLLRSTLAGGQPAKKKVEEIHPALHYFAKASTEFASTLPLMKDRDNSFLADLVTSTSRHDKTITSGFYRQEAGAPLVYAYEYHEMKIIVAGEFHISDDRGNSVVATAGDVFYFPKGSVITFDSPSFGLGFFCGQRVTGTA